MRQDAISVVMPARNCAQTIRVAVESIVQQTYPNLELIIVDDNSTDGTWKVVQELARRYDNVRAYALPFDDPHRIGWNGKNVNAGWAARNYGMERADGDWITFQDADDASLLNRISVQYDFAQRYQSSHVCLDWQKYDDIHVGKVLDVKRILDLHGAGDLLIRAEEILSIARTCKGFIPSHFGWLPKRVPHHRKLHPRFERLFFGDLSSPYPGAANHCLVRKEVFPRVRFHPLNERVWPSRRGRGADRDFNFAVAELVQNSISVRLPLYLWRVRSDHPAYGGAEYVPVEPTGS